MPDEKDAVEQFGDELLSAITDPVQPRAGRGDVPEQAQLKDAAAKKKRAKEISRGVVTKWRLHPDIKPAIKQAAEDQQVTQRDLVEYLLAIGLVGIERGKFKPPKSKTGAIFSIEQPEIPKRFLE